jgi:hypothetical protein
VLQFAGTYAHGGGVLFLGTDATYRAVISGHAEDGRVVEDEPTSHFPIVLRLVGLTRRSASIAGFDREILVVPGGSLRLLRPDASDESLCEATGGRWTDDDPDPGSGLYCACPTGRFFIPSEGGCVELTSGT